MSTVEKGGLSLQDSKGLVLDLLIYSWQSVHENTDVSVLHHVLSRWQYESVFQLCGPSVPLFHVLQLFFFSRSQITFSP